MSIKKLYYITYKYIRAGFQPTILLGIAFALTGCRGLLLAGGAKNKSLDKILAPDTSITTEISDPATIPADTTPPDVATSLGWSQSSPYNSTAAAISVYKDVV